MGSDTADGEPTPARSPETVDRILVGVCGAIWLVLLAACVIATVALVRLASGHAGGAERHSSWLLYSVIAISALVIIGAVPLLLRARRTAAADSGVADTLAAAAPPLPGAEVPNAKARVFGVDPYARADPDVPPAAPPVSAAVVERLWLRGTVSLLAAMGLALIAVEVATYLLAVSSDTAAWVALGFAGVVTVAMPAVLVFFQRRISEAVG